MTAYTSPPVVAITGAARGIGRATAEALKAKGAKVAIGDIDEDVAKETGAALGVYAAVLDVTSRASYTAFLDAAEAELGPIDVLVNNAGIMPIGPLEEEDDTIAARCLDINVHGVILGTKLGLARMVPRGHGHIVNIASVAGVTPAPGLATYNASKHAVVGFTEAVRMEFQDRGIAVSAVLPTFTNTELVAGTRTPKGQRNAEPEDVAAAVVALIAEPRAQVYVPAGLRRQIRLGGLLPARVRESLARRYGLYDIFLTPDKEARKSYDDRIRR